MGDGVHLKINGFPRRANPGLNEGSSRNNRKEEAETNNTAEMDSKGTRPVTPMLGRGR